MKYSSPFIIKRAQSDHNDRTAALLSLLSLTLGLPVATFLPGILGGYLIGRKYGRGREGALRGGAMTTGSIFGAPVGATLGLLPGAALDLALFRTLGPFSTLGSLLGGATGSGLGYYLGNELYSILSGKDLSGEPRKRKED